MKTAVLPVEYLDNYRVTNVLSKRVGLTVYLGEHRISAQKVVIKVLSSPLIYEARYVACFQREAKLIQRVSHPYIVKLYAQGETKQGLYMALEWVEGVSLREYLLAQPISLPKAISLTIDIAEALGHLHSQKILHKDIKPENVIMTPLGTIKLIDLGLSAWDGSVYSGTPCYMSPEQKRGGSLSPASDLYSLALITYELLIGNLSLGQIHLKLLPERMSRLLAKALHPVPKERFSSAKEFVQALHDYRVHDLLYDLKPKDITVSDGEQLYKQRGWLAPTQVVSPDWMTVHICEQGSQLYPYVHYALFSDHQRALFWFCFGLSDNVTLALSIMKYLTNQWGNQADIKQTLYRIHEEFIRMEVPLDETGLSVICVSIPKEKDELACFACGKTIFAIKQRSGGVRHYETSSLGLGSRATLHIRETKGAWEVGDAIFLRTLRKKISSSDGAFVELKDREQTAIFCSTDGMQIGAREATLYPSTLISLKRVQ